MKWYIVDSSFISKIGYDSNTNQVGVVISGKTYIYYNVPYYVFRDFLDSLSKGRYLNTVMKRYSNNSL